MECDVTGDFAAASCDGYFALATRVGYFQSSKVVYTSDRIASVLNGVKMVKTDFCRDYHLLAHLESSLRRRDRDACIGQLYFLSDGAGGSQRMEMSGIVRAESRLGGWFQARDPGQLPPPRVLATYVTETNFCELSPSTLRASRLHFPRWSPSSILPLETAHRSRDEQPSNRHTKLRSLQQ